MMLMVMMRVIDGFVDGDDDGDVGDGGGDDYGDGNGGGDGVHDDRAHTLLWVPSLGSECLITHMARSSEPCLWQEQTLLHLSAITAARRCAKRAETLSKPVSSDRRARFPLQRVSPHPNAGGVAPNHGSRAGSNMAPPTTSEL